MIKLQQCNILNLPENYNYMYYAYHSTSWPHLLFLAEDDGGKCVGYVLAKLEDEDNDKNKAKKEKPDYRPEAHITSLSVLRTHRKLGLATKLMKCAQYQMMNVYGCDSCSLRVRVTNRAAYTLYKDVLGYEVCGTDKAYYADKEDAYDMRVKFQYAAVDPDAEDKEASILSSEKGSKGSIQLAESDKGKAEKKEAKPIDEKEEVKADESATTEATTQAAKTAEKNRKKREK